MQCFGTVGEWRAEECGSDGLASLVSSESAPVGTRTERAGERFIEKSFWPRVISGRVCRPRSGTRLLREGQNDFIDSIGKRHSLDSANLDCGESAVPVGLHLWRRGKVGELADAHAAVVSLIGICAWHFAVSSHLAAGPWFALIAAPGPLFLIAGLLTNDRPVEAVRQQHH